MSKDKKRIFEGLEIEAYNRLTHYHYNRSEELHPRYHKGHIAALRWMPRLSHHYLARETALRREIPEVLKREKRRIAWMEPGPYRQRIENTPRGMRHLLEE